MGFDILATIFPLSLLVWLMTKRRPWSSNHALPLVALVLYGLMIAYFRIDAVLLNAATIDGLLTALTPIFIVGGAVLLFKTMEHSGALAMIQDCLEGVTSNKVGQLMIIGWSFSFLIEGVSGFGTPAALAAPLLVGLGFPPVRAATLCLIMNSVPVSFGAVGMPTWFGFGELNLGAAKLADLGFRTALIHTAAALVIPILALRAVVSTREIGKNIVFIYLSVAFSVLPYLAAAKVSVEFPSIIGGFIGLVASILFAKHGIGLAESSPTRSKEPLFTRRAVKVFFPLWGTILVLAFTRIPFLGLREWLVAVAPSWAVSFGSLGEFRISSSLVLQLRNILGTEINWKHAVLYVPSIIPFVLISFFCFLIFRVPREAVLQIGHETWQRIQKPILALLGAMVFVKLMMLGGLESRAVFLGQTLADTLGSHWRFAAVYFGALGAFFSGSNTVSNLMFGPVQDSLAKTLDINRTTLLSLQSVGGAMGNMVCIHNIVAVCSILGLSHQEGTILKRTFLPMLIYGVVANVVFWIFLTTGG